MQAHLSSGVVMDIAAFKVSHSSDADKDATALQDARGRSSSTGAMDEMSQGFKRQARLSCLIRVHSGVGERRHALMDEESTTLQAKPSA